MPIPVTCSACGERTYAASDDSGRTVGCPRCNAGIPVPGEFTPAGDGDGRPESQADRRNVRRSRSSRDGVKATLLVSAIANIVVGLIWGSTCFGIVLTIPMIVLSVFEMMLWQAADTLPADRLASRSRTMAIFEIVLGLFNTPTLVCGILILVYAGRLPDEYD